MMKQIFRTTMLESTTENSFPGPARPAQDAAGGGQARRSPSPGGSWPEAAGSRSQSRDYGWLVALVLPLFALAPLLMYAGLPNTADGPVHLMRQVELNQAWSQGNFYPRWGTDLALGHGMPIFSYAPPLLYHLTQLFHLTGLPLDEAMKAVLIVAFLLYSGGMFLFARPIFGSYPALLAAAVYVYAPYRLREAYIQGNYGQFLGLAFYPLIFWSFHGLVTDGRPRYLLAAALSLAGLLFSHNISAMLFAPLLAAYLLFLLLLIAFSRGFSGFSPACLRTLAGGLLGLGLAAIFWLPAFGERHDIKLEGITQGFFDFRENFISLSEFFSPPLPLDLTAINPEFPLSLGLPQIIWAGLALLSLCLTGIGYGLSKVTPPKAPNPKTAESSNLPPTPHGDQEPETGNRRPPAAGEAASLPRSPAPLPLCPAAPLPHTLFFAAFLLLYAFLALPASQGVWEAVPLLELAEFPWRMLGPAIFCAALLAAPAFITLDRSIARIAGPGLRQLKSRLPGAVHPIQPASRPPESPSPQPLSPTPYASSTLPPLSSSVTPFVLLLAVLATIALNAYYLYPSQFIPWGTPTPAEAFAYEATSGAIGTTSTGEFLPRAARQHPEPDVLGPDYEAGRPPRRLDPTALPAGATVETISHLAESDTLRIETPQEFEATLRTLYWPGWRLYLNGRPLPFSVAPRTGLIQATIPAGRHTLTLTLESTPLRRWGQWLTIGSMVIIGGIFIFTVSRQAGIVNRLPPAGRGRLAARPAPPVRRRPAAVNEPLLPAGDRRPASGGQISAKFFAVSTTLLIAAYLLSRPLAPLFVLRSDPNQPRPADRVGPVDFGDQLRLVGLETWPPTIQVEATEEAEIVPVLYWRAWPGVEKNYSVFIHLDAPTGQTFATVDEVHPENIPTRNWPPDLYLRNPLPLHIPAGIPPIRYDVTAGVYDRQTNDRLPVAGGQGDVFKIGSLWVTRPPPALDDQPAARFGSDIVLRQAALEAEALTLHWQARQPLPETYTIFVHLLDADGRLLGQADGAPYEGLYPLADWLPDQIITDRRLLAPYLEDKGEDKSRLNSIAVGVYNVVTGERLPAVDAAGQPLPNNRLVLFVAS